jgi:hypothetical protein
MGGQWIFLFVPVLIIVVFVAVKWLLKKLEPLESALELHLAGITYLSPLPIVRTDLVEPLTFAVLVSCLFLCVTIACYVVVKFRLNGNVKMCERIGLLTGGSIFFFGFVATILTS